MAIRVEALAGHDRSAFACGEPELDAWFRERASQDQRRNVSRVFVAVDDQIGVVGFYSLSSFSLEHRELPTEISRRLPRYGVLPAALIGRLARDTRTRGQGVGELLLADAIVRTLRASVEIAVLALIVDAKNERAAVFYEGMGFERFPDDRSRLFLLTSAAADWLRSKAPR